MVRIRLQHNRSGFVRVKFSADNLRACQDVLAEIQRRTLRSEREYWPQSRAWLFADTYDFRQALHYVREFYPCQIVEFVSGDAHDP